MKLQSQIEQARVNLARACLVGTLACIAVAGRSVGDEVYKTVDPSGHVVYSDHPTSSAAQKVDVQVTQPDPVEAARLAKQHALEDADFAQRSKQEAADASKQAAQAKQDEARCTAARNRYNFLMQVNRLYRVDADGNRAYYSDEEADAMRATAKQTMTSACGK
jgi:hypothetical protein